MKFKAISDELKDKVETLVKLLLHAGRDAQRNRKEDTVSQWLSPNNSYYGEAFGIMRGLALTGHGYFGSSNLDALVERGFVPPPEGFSTQAIHNLRWWFSQINQQVRIEENFGSTDECDYCLNRYGKDSAGRSA